MDPSPRSPQDGTSAQPPSSTFAASFFSPTPTPTTVTDNRHHTQTRTQQLPDAVVMEVSSRIHATPETIRSALLSDMPGCFSGAPRPATPTPPTPKEVSFSRRLRLNLQATTKSHLYHLVLEPQSASAPAPAPAPAPALAPVPAPTSSSISIRPATAASIQVLGSFQLAPSKYDTCELTMTARINTSAPAARASSSSSAISASSSQISKALSGEQQVGPKDALLLLGDLLSLVAALFEAYARCDEIDKLAHEELVKYFATTKSTPAVHEDALVEKSLGFQDKTWR
ncbi:hypothetical protein TeGR_g8587 [Tetraparma gracilis]|uniref:Uncharacterized protein n=1 Tax=Tetraparma gracilis TaxID=2962635 RepID=A0ABQ6MG17_9STRA|nr:hypothetical protein TeGR_g8587 [Tetraparma gracilis]